ncbi:MAG TPA: homoserine kinase [Caulobacteraceae bacterium]|nr:homoserine kinase [Caulobacteraceae bacterium]
MAVYTDITDEELEGLLAQYDLGPPIAFKGIAEGVSNSNFLLETQAGRFILTVYEKHFVESELPYFMQLMEHLADHGFPSATPIHARDGAVLKKVRGKPCALISFLPGLSARRPTAAHCREAGEGLAWLHVAGEGFAGRRPNALGQEHWARFFHPLRGAAERLKPGLAETIEQDLATFAAGWPRGLPEGTVHADFFPDNVFFHEGKFAGAIDFYFACDDALAYDVAVALNAWCFEADGSFNLTAARNLLAGYEKRRALSDEERAALPMLAHGAAMRFFLTRLADWETTPEGALVRPKDPLEYERKLAVHRAGLALMGEAA